MGWPVHWVSSSNCNFGNDCPLTYSPIDIEAGNTFRNYREGSQYGEHSPGVSVIAKDESGSARRTYSCYGCGLGMLNGADHLLDLVPKGRDETALSANMAWMRLHHQYLPKPNFW